MALGDIIAIVYILGGMSTVAWAFYLGVFDDHGRDPLLGAAIIFMLWWLLAPAALGAKFRKQAAKPDSTNPNTERQSL